MRLNDQMETFAEEKDPNYLLLFSKHDYIFQYNRLESKFRDLNMTKDQDQIIYSYFMLAII